MAVIRTFDAAGGVSFETFFWRRAEYFKPDIDKHVALDRRENRLERKFAVLKKAARHLQGNAAAPHSGRDPARQRK